MSSVSGAMHVWFNSIYTLHILHVISIHLLHVIPLNFLHVTSQPDDDDDVDDEDDDDEQCSTFYIPLLHTLIP